MEDTSASSSASVEKLVALDVYDFFYNFVFDSITLIRSLSDTIDKIRQWDKYHALTHCTREKRGTGTRQCVSGTAKIPGNWQKFWQMLITRKNRSYFCPERKQKCNYLMSRMSTSLQIIKSTMLETVHQWVNATMGKRTPIFQYMSSMTAKQMHLGWFILEIQM